jgi:hypothetical protein
MTKKILDNPSINDFINVSIKYCALIENRNKLKTIKFLQEIYKLLPLICYYGMYLPYIPSANLINRKIKRRTKQWKVLFNSLKRKLKKYDLYLEIFDPYEFKEKEPVHGSLSDDLADIYLELSIGVREWRKANSSKRKNIVFEWWLYHEIHWGEHATGAFRAIHCLLFRHLEDKDGFYVGIRKL